VKKDAKKIEAKSSDEKVCPLYGIFFSQFTKHESLFLIQKNNQSELKDKEKKMEAKLSLENVCLII
jgi:hypothetical protein